MGFTSSHCHYSYQKAAFLTGLGTDNLVAVDTDEMGQMLPCALEAAIQEAVAQGKVTRGVIVAVVCVPRMLSGNG